MKSKVVTAGEAVALVQDGNTICCNGFVQSGIPEAALEALEKRFLETGHPNNLRLFAAAGQADGKERGLNRLGHEGILRKVVAGNWGRMPKVAKLALDNKIFAYNLPQGVICQLYITLASGKPGFFSKVGLQTFVDPRLEGGRVNECTTKDIVKLVQVEGGEWLFYTVGTVDVAFIRGTTADPSGNITMEKESLTLDNLAQAMAAKNCNGIVIAQVERIAEQGSLNEGVAAIANEEKVTQYITLTAEAGTVGGVLAGGGNFGAGVNADAVFDQSQMFDFYDGGGLDMACLGMAECDEQGNVNVSRFGPRLIGCGGFINISQNARSMVFAGTFTAGGLKVGVSGGKLQILQEGKARKFVKKVNQVSFSGEYAMQRGQPVYFITERCVFQRGHKGLVLTEVAPGIDIEKDILALMDFVPIIRESALMDSRIFLDGPMGLEADLLNLDLPDRISYDPARNILFLNFEGMYVRVKEDIETLRALLEKRCREIGKRVGVFVNYDSFRINENVADDLAEMDRYMLENYWTNVTRYATSAFMRMKLDQAFSKRDIAPHVFERKEEAQAFLTSGGN